MAVTQLDIEVGKRLTELINALPGISNRQFSLSIEMDPSQFNKIQRGMATLSLEKVVEISSKYNVSIDWLLKGEGKIFIVEAKTSRQERDDEQPVTVVFKADEVKKIEESLIVLQKALNKLPKSDKDGISGSSQRLPLGNNEIGLELDT